MTELIKIVDITQYVKIKYKREKNLIYQQMKSFKKDFFQLIDKVNLSLMEDKENFYGYFLFQMGREIRFDITSANINKF